MTTEKHDTLEFGDISDAVAAMQLKLIRRGFMPPYNKNGRSNSDRKYGPITSASVLKFQNEMASLGLLDDTEVVGRIAGPRMLALLYNCETQTTPGLSPNLPTNTLDWPPKPPFGALNNAGRRAMFGEFKYTPRVAKTKNGESIKIVDEWTQNLETIYIPQLDGVPFYTPGNKLKCVGRVTLHKLAIPNWLCFFNAAETHGLLPLIRTFDGAYNPRFQRGSKTELSNHAFGTAMDFNGYANPLNRKPAATGVDGCLLPLVEIANACGIFWGGFYKTRKDGMHFEVVKLLEGKP